MRFPNLKSLAMAVMAVGATGLAGCITLLPEVKPIQLYTIRFNSEVVDKPLAPAPTVSEPVDLFLNFDNFPRAAAGDRILTTEGNEVSYVSGGRWASAAQGQFRDLLSEGFARAGSDRLRIGGQGRVTAKYRVDVDVRRFEAAYARRRPTIVVALDARVVRLSDRKVVAQRFISSDVAVRKSDLTLMVEGFEKASSQAVVNLIGFTEEAVAAAEAETPAPVVAPEKK
ncbi:ABC-type transport auxiliary lipoprotein family protein [Asticcacaulis sp. BYS171W]|uniref:ABC-type transport auxiliary lipoprotein family protein n=1 Tax=Asticcacaulis aquaticus TaxID=2984212 RepID=A0ABT5HU02_9CAUL|nr:ABC-type transport auxiliary lipoprotein family protein [Asticcacaulis aquaticus]MDC7683423.1 ABC-type transport auxiliary lipoprotein family protein [Asticcacaulis aquaticus]